jgi:RNA-splicing ligase RtcB
MTEQYEPAEDPELDRIVATSEDEYDRGADEEPGRVSIDDALETDRVASEGADSRNADGYGFDADLERGADDATAAEQGNRDEDRMEAETAEQELPER